MNNIKKTKLNINLILISFYFFLSPTISSANSVEEALRADNEIWSKNGLLCAVEAPLANQSNVYFTCPKEKECFPGEGREPQEQPSCGDGDMTLFNSLLCLSGINEGCIAVENAQNRITGQWFRSPRLAKIPSLKKSNSFSPDMALGVELWSSLYKSSRSEKIQWWLNWIGYNQRCSGDGCIKRIPRFCPDDDLVGDPDSDYGCTLRPGDAATLFVTAKFLNIKTKDENLDTVLKYWGKDAVNLAYTSAISNDSGYSQHLSAVNILLLWRLGYKDSLLDKASSHLANSQKENPFFAWLAGEDLESVAKKTLGKCPTSTELLPKLSMRNDWIWQRKDISDSSKNTMVWDCRFMASIIRNNIKPKGY